MRKIPCMTLLNSLIPCMTLKSLKFPIFLCAQCVAVAISFRSTLLSINTSELMEIDFRLTPSTKPRALGLNIARAPSMSGTSAHALGPSLRAVASHLPGLSNFATANLLPSLIGLGGPSRSGLGQPFRDAQWASSGRAPTTATAPTASERS
jgi:hypothetical protein